MENNLITEIFDLDAIKRQIADAEQLSTKLTAGIKANVEEVKRAQNEASNAKGVADTEKAIDNLKNSTKELSEANSQLSKIQKELNTLKEKEAFLLTDEGKKLSTIVEAQKRANKEKNEALLLADALAQATQKEVKSISDAQTKIAELQKALKQCNLTTKEGKDTAESYKNEISKLNGFIKENTTVIDQQKRNVSTYKDAIAGLEAGERTLGDAISKTKEELEKMELQRLKGIDFTKEQTAEYYKLQGALAQMTKAQQEVSTKTQVLTTNYIGLKATIEKLKLGANVLTSLSAATALLGGDSEKLNSIMQKVIATQQILNTVTQIQEQLSSRSIISIEAQKGALEGVASSTDKVSAKTGLFGTALTKLGTGFKSFFSIFKGGNIIIAAFTAAITLATKMISDHIEGQKEYNKELKKEIQNREEINKKRREEIELEKQKVKSAVAIGAAEKLNLEAVQEAAKLVKFVDGQPTRGSVDAAVSHYRESLEANLPLLFKERIADLASENVRIEFQIAAGGNSPEEVARLDAILKANRDRIAQLESNIRDVKNIATDAAFAAQGSIVSMAKNPAPTTTPAGGEGGGTGTGEGAGATTTVDEKFEKEKKAIEENYNYKKELEGDSYNLQIERIDDLLDLYEKYGKNSVADLTEILKLKKELSQIDKAVVDDNYKYREQKINDEFDMLILEAETLNKEGKADIDINALKIEKNKQLLELTEKYVSTLKEQKASEEEIAEAEIYLSTLKEQGASPEKIAEAEIYLSILKKQGASEEEIAEAEKKVLEIRQELADLDTIDYRIKKTEELLRVYENYVLVLKEQGASLEEIAKAEEKVLETREKLAGLQSGKGKGNGDSKEEEITDAGILSGKGRKNGKRSKEDKDEDGDEKTLLMRANEEYGGVLDAISKVNPELGDSLWKKIGKISDKLKEAKVSSQSFMDTLKAAGVSANKLYEQGLSTLLDNMSTVREEAFAQQKEAIAEDLKLTNEWLDENVTNSEQRERMKEIAQKEADKKTAELQYQQKVREQNQAAVMAIIDGISAGMKALLASIKDFGTAGIATGMAQLAIAAGTGVAQAGLIKAQKIPRYEEGTDYAVGGLALVGEAGREIIQTRDGATLVEQPSIVNLSPGDKVYPNMETERILSQQSITNNYNSGSEITVEADTFKITEETSKSLKKRKLINKRLNLKF